MEIHKNIGQIDELRIWDAARSETQIRDHMCKRLTGNEANLVTYYRFDHSSGTFLADLSTSANHAALISMNDSNWVTSGAAIGDVSIYDYTGSVYSDFVVNIASSQGDQLTATGDGGSYTGIHLYLINESPNITSHPTGCNAIDTDHYWGIFPIGTNPTYEITYNYTGNSFVDNENVLKLAYRENNSISTWSDANTTLNTSLNTLSQTSYTRAEFVLGDSSPNISEIPDQASAASDIPFTITCAQSGNMNITVTSSNNTLISNANINVAASGSNTYVESITAGSPVPLTLSLSPTANEHGLVTLTVTVTGSDGSTNSKNFKVIVSPPGSGNTLDFDGVDDYIELSYHEDLNSDIFTVSIWAKVEGGSGSFRSPFTSRNTCYGYLIYADTNETWSFHVGDSSGCWKTLFGTQIVYNQWTHLAMTYDGSNFRGYINGELQGQTQVIFAKNTSKPLRIGAGNTQTTPSAFFNGQLDEFRYYQTVLSQDEIQAEMCKRINSSKADLKAYYRFDHSTGTTLTDLTGLGHHASLYNMDNSDWVTSGAALGDVSVYDYTGTIVTDFEVNLASSNGYQFTAIGDGGSYTGIHLYLINESPNITNPPYGWNGIDTDHYWGIFPVGTSPTYEITYNYNGNPFVTNEDAMKLAYREDHSVNVWSRSTATTNTGANTINKTNETRAEYILAENKLEITDIPTKQITDSPITLTITDKTSVDVYITVSSSNNNIISNTNINIAGCGSNSYTHTMTADIPVPLTIAFPNTAGQYGFVTLTVTAQNSNGITCLTKFYVIISPPGPGNALVFDGVNDYVNAGDAINFVHSSFSIEFWAKRNSTNSANIIGQGSSSNNAGLHIGFRDTNAFTFAFFANDLDTPAYTDLNWHHWALTYNSSTKDRKIFRDGNLVASDIATSNYLGSGDLYIGRSFASCFFQGHLDELRIWNNVRSENDIRDNMCKTLTGNEASLIAYYRFDHTSGTTLQDLSGNNHTGALIDMDNSDWIISGAALGDVSIYDYTGPSESDFIVTLASSQGDQLTAIGDGGTYTGFQLYLVNESPNITTPPSGWNAIDTDHYWGIFPIGINPTYEIFYNYNGNSFVDNANALNLAYSVTSGLKVYQKQHLKVYHFQRKKLTTL